MRIPIVVGDRLEVKDFGNFKTFEIESVTNASTVTFDLGQLPSQDGDCELAVVDMYLSTPGIEVTGAISTEFDAISLVQPVKKLFLSLASNAPPTRFDKNRHMLINGLDLYYVLEYFSRTTQANVFLSAGSEDWVQEGALAADATGADSANNKIDRSEQWNRNNIPLVNRGPYGGGDSTSTFAFNASGGLQFCIPIGRRNGEEVRSTAIPNRWFNGCRHGCDQSSAGKFTFTRGTTIDGQTITYTGTWTLIVNCIRVPREKIPCPAVPFMELHEFDSKNQRLNRGLRGLLALMPPLQDDGDMQTQTYSQVALNVGGVEVIDNDVVRNAYQTLTDKQGMTMPWQFPGRSITGRNKTRYNSPGILLAPLPESAFLGIGDLYEEPRITIVSGSGCSTADNPHNVFDVVLTPATAEVQDAANSWTGAAEGRTEPNPRNGNMVPTNGLEAAVPAVTRAIPAAK